MLNSVLCDYCFHLLFFRPCRPN